MKIIDLLNKIANGEEVPNKIIYNHKEFEFIRGAYEDEEGNDLCYYDYSCTAFLLATVEILEEKKIPEKFKINYEIDEENTINMEKATMLECDLACRINEIIDYLKSKGE